MFGTVRHQKVAPSALESALKFNEWFTRSNSLRMIHSATESLYGIESMLIDAVGTAGAAYALLDLVLKLFTWATLFAKQRPVHR